MEMEEILPISCFVLPNITVSLVVKMTSKTKQIQNIYSLNTQECIDAWTDNPGHLMAVCPPTPRKKNMDGWIDG